MNIVSGTSGTTEEVVVPLLEQEKLAGLRVARDGVSWGFHVAFSPEREDPGNDFIPRRDIRRVVGGCAPTALELASAVYAGIFNRTVSVSSPVAAEMTKLLENIYRCVTIALVNELKQLCMHMDIDIFEVIDTAKTNPSGFRRSIQGLALADTASPLTRFTFSGRPNSSTSTHVSSSWPDGLDAMRHSAAHLSCVGLIYSETLPHVSSAKAPLQTSWVTISLVAS